MSSSAESLTTATPPTKKRRVESSEAEEDNHSSNGTKNGVLKDKVIWKKLKFWKNSSNLKQISKN